MQPSQGRIEPFRRLRCSPLAHVQLVGLQLGTPQPGFAEFQASAGSRTRLQRLMLQQAQQVAESPELAPSFERGATQKRCLSLSCASAAAAAHTQSIPRSPGSTPARPEVGTGARKTPCPRTPVTTTGCGRAWRAHWGSPSPHAHFARPKAGWLPQRRTWGRLAI